MFVKSRDRSRNRLFVVLFYKRRGKHNATERETREQRQGGGGFGVWWDRLVIISRNQEKGRRKIHTYIKSDKTGGLIYIKEGKGGREREMGTGQGQIRSNKKKGGKEYRKK